MVNIVGLESYSTLSVARFDMWPKSCLTFPHVNLIPIFAGDLLDLLCGRFRQGRHGGDIGISSIFRVVFQGKVVDSANTKFFLDSENVSICMVSSEGHLIIPSLHPKGTEVGCHHNLSLQEAQVIDSSP